MSIRLPDSLTINLSGGILCVMFALAHFLPPRLMQGYVPKIPSEAWSELSSSDPEIGTVVSQNLFTAVRSAIVIVVSDCSECSVERLRTLNRLKCPIGVRKTAMVLSGLDQYDKDKLSAVAPSISIVAAPANLREEWNAAFFPRVYAVDNSFRLVYVQDWSLPFENALLGAAETLKQ